MLVAQDKLPGEIDIPSVPRARIALGVEYIGTAYQGWQFQPHAPSVQGVLDAALSSVADETVTTLCAGRTDSGVHGYGQVVHFECTKTRPLKAWTLGVNTRLPDDVSIAWARMVDAEFHARFSAQARTYHYVIQDDGPRCALLADRISYCRSSLDHIAMGRACRAFYGEQDFSAVRASACQSRTPWRNVQHLSVERMGQFVLIRITANAFLHHMVRNIAGVLIAIGRGDQAPDWAETLLAGRDRTRAPATAPAAGLYLVRVEYPGHFGIPPPAAGPWLWQL